MLKLTLLLLDVCQGTCMPIDFVELLHGEALDSMGTTERFLCKKCLITFRIHIFKF